MENKILATVNGIAITENEVNEIIAGLGPRGQAYNNPEGRQAVLGQLIASKLLLIEARPSLHSRQSLQEYAKISLSAMQPTRRFRV